MYRKKIINTRKCKMSKKDIVFCSILQSYIICVFQTIDVNQCKRNVNTYIRDGDVE